MTAPVIVEYLYGTWQTEDDKGYLVDRIIPFRIVKKTAKRVFYVKDWIHDTTNRLGSVDRQQLEATGEIWKRSCGWWDPEIHLTVEIPQIDNGRVDASVLKAELMRLRTEMALVHPDRGGTDADFIAAHKRYKAARDRFARAIGGES